ncbi:MAG: hypothetical protein HY355_00645 [Armatimonadetes bacterium]|nr:hypothetical protein [Armatimonadota bacterium]
MKVELDREQVILFTPHHRIEGDLHLPATARLSDRLNAAKDFLPITSARVFSLDGRLLYETNVVLVHKAHVVMMMERHETL